MKRCRAAARGARVLLLLSLVHVIKSDYASHGTALEYAFPSGEGTYSALLARLAVNVGYRF